MEPEGVDLLSILLPSLGVLLVSTVVAVLLAWKVAQSNVRYRLSDMPA